MPLVLEVVPPPLRRGPEAVDKIVARVARLHGEVELSAVNVPEIREEESKSDAGVRRNPYEPRVAPRELAARIQEEVGVPAIVNRVVVHLAEPRQADWLRESYERFGIRSLVLVGGERGSIRYPGPTPTRAAEMVRELLPPDSVRLGSICIANRRGGELDEPERMERKSAGGSSFFTSQIVYHPAEFTRLLDDLHTRAPRAQHLPILLSVCPLTSAKSVDFLRFLGVDLSDDLAAELTRDPEQVLERSIDHLSAMWETILSHTAEHALPTPLGINLAPIGAVRAGRTIELATRLRSIANRVLEGSTRETS